MKNRIRCCWGISATTLAVTVLLAPPGRADEATGPGDAASVATGAAPTIVQLDRWGAAARRPALEGRGERSDGVTEPAADARQHLDAAELMDGMGGGQQGGAGLRAIGDNNIDLYDNLQGTTFSTAAHDFGDDWRAELIAPLNQAYVLDELSFAVLRIQSTTVETWARIKFWKTYDLDVASDPDCPGDLPVHTEQLGQLIINCGVQAPDDVDCTTFDRFSVNLVTGVMTDLFTGAIVSEGGASIISNSSPIGSIPLGTGEFQAFFTIEFGQPNPGGTDIIPGPTDSCGDGTSPGGHPLFNSQGQATLFGTSNGGYYRDEFGGPADGEWNCTEGLLTFFPGFNGGQFKLRGSLGADCDSNGIVDAYELASDPSTDDGTLCASAVADNGVLDACECLDCNTNGIFDVEEIMLGLADDCELEGNDCNSNGIPDDCDIADCLPEDPFCGDCNSNGILDGCDIDPADPDGSGGFWADCDANGRVDACERVFFDCNANGLDDFCDIVNGLANDFDGDSIPDACQGRAHTLDFEDVGSNDFDYVLAPVDDQPREAVIGEGSINVGEWNMFDRVPLDVAPTVPGFADVEAGALDGGVKLLTLKEVTSNGVPSDEWAVMGPHIFFANPDIETVFSYRPRYQEMSLDIRFNADASDVDWDFYFGTIFAGPVGDSTTVFVDDARVIVSFDTDTTTTGMPTVIRVIDDDGTTITAVDWSANPGTVHQLRVVIDLRDQAAIDPLTDAGTVYWDGEVLTTFTPNQSANGLDIMDKLWIEQDRNGSTVAFQSDSVRIDNITLLRSEERISCDQFLLPDGNPSGDCDGNGICDFHETDLFDLDGNGILDHCEGYAGDCNHNFVLDSVEIAEDSAPDLNLNGVIDWCEPATGHNVNFESFVVGLLDDQLGWQEYTQVIDGGASEIVQNNLMTGSVTKYLQVQESPETPATFAIILGPRKDNVGDADIELWAWDMRITNADFGRLFVEILDIQEDAANTVTATTTAAGGRTLLFQPFIDAVNTGLQWTTIDPFGEPLGNIDILMLTDPGGDRAYTVTSASSVASQVVGTVRAAGLRILNSRGTVQAFWAPNQASMLNLSGGAFQHLISLAATETQGSIEFDAATIRRGGDRQIMIRSDGDFGDEGTTEFWFDNLTYRTWTDCDNDGRADEDFLLTPFGMQFDRNGDGIQDNCQDCDDDCPGDFPIAVGAIACLDPLELVGHDCNGNGIPDNCDINPNLPFEGMFDVAGCTPDSVQDICFHSRRGGGSCNLNGNGIPDECEGDDCNGDGCLDTAEIAADPSLDLNLNGILDACEADCNHNGQPDTFDISTGDSQDRYPDFPVGDGIPDECCSYTPNGDMDGDDDVDTMDYQLMQQCIGVVAGSASGLADWDQNACGCADMNADGVVDDLDVQVLLYFVTGPDE